MHIYILTNEVNGKVYIGQSVNSPEKRRTAHMYNSRTEQARRRQAISMAIHKHGWENFSHDVLEVCETQDALNLAETIWIERYNCMTPRGYNLTSGGGNCGKQSQETIEKRAAAHRGRKCSEETRSKMSKSALSVVMSDDHRRKCVDNFKKASDANVGIPLSEGTKEKLRSAMKGRKPSPTSSNEESKKKMAEAAKQWWAEERERIAQGLPPRRGAKKLS